MSTETIHAGAVLSGGPRGSILAPRTVTAKVMKRLALNDIVENVEFPVSEAAVHLRVGGLVGHVQLVGEPGREMAQVLDLDFKAISFPVTPGEAGVYRDADGFYVYAEAV